jgi:hypothetical protein
MLEAPETHVVSRKLHEIPAEFPDQNASESKGTRPSQMLLHGSLISRKNRKPASTGISTVMTEPWVPSGIG